MGWFIWIAIIGGIAACVGWALLVINFWCLCQDVSDIADILRDNLEVTDCDCKDCKFDHERDDRIKAMYDKLAEANRTVDDCDEHGVQGLLTSPSYRAFVRKWVGPI